MKKGINEIWADNYSQGIRQKIQELEFMRNPVFYNFSATSIFKNPKKKAIKKVRKFAEKWNYGFIFYKHCREFPGFPNGFGLGILKRCDLSVVLYRRLLKPQKILEDIE